ncbi:TldD/PmbA family protein [Oscillatoria sp. CS-180]|uniref:TldD/PmbA family protein n=1 Tax=Oscillatoria sp. CS-180 TaxID=3021720 RepID=UPI00232DE554|nr:TldD/PmbA family protein [Oscillatoria sp. CS-180]MDB9524973.1 TldD/PmbA family protein [Oscillatoria sp. CS-180]
MGAEANWDTLPEQLLDLAKQAGAEAAEVFQSSSSARPVFFEANRLKQLESNQLEGTALRLWTNGCPGIAVAHGPISPQALVDKAIAISQLNDAETIELSRGMAQRYPDVGVDVPVSQMIEWGETAIAEVRDRYPEVICEAELECDTEVTRFVNSLGLDYSYSDTTLSSYLAVEWVRGDDFLIVGDGQVCRDALFPNALAHHILERLIWAERNVPPVVGRVPVLFTAKAADTLWGTVQSALSGKRVLEGSSPWSDRIGEKVTSEALTLYQDPDEGPYSCPFDDEGTPTQKLVLIDQGELRLFYTDRTIGKELGGGSTGNGFRPGLGSAPTPGLFNTLIQPGQSTFADLIKSLSDAIIVDQILGETAGISGDFSVNVDLGYRVKNGQIQGRVKDTMVSGNVYTALLQLQALGQDADWNGPCYTPSVLLEGLSVTGRR